MLSFLQIAVKIYIAAAIYSALIFTVLGFTWLCAVILAVIAGVAA